MNVDEFAAWIVGEAENFQVNWKDEAGLDPAEFPANMTRLEWLKEFTACLPVE